jgi:hypothetical protein
MPRQSSDTSACAIFFEKQMKKEVSIGCFSGFWGDSMWGAAQLAHGELKLDYLVGDYLAEVTMGILAKTAREKNGGFVQEFCDRVWTPLGETLLQRGTKVVTNAGGMNPLGLKAALEQVAQTRGWRCKVAAVFGDDVTLELSSFPSLRVFPGEEQQNAEKLASANIYFGARGIAEALRRGADVVVTGRVVDSALVLGPLAAHFGWSWTQHQLLAAGSVIGHILECGCQTTGGNFTDWRKTPSWQNVGFPVALCRADGTAVITKVCACVRVRACFCFLFLFFFACLVFVFLLLFFVQNPGTGGMVTIETVTEQLMYEIGDPANYLLPDVTVDFTGVQLLQDGVDRVLVSGAKGRAPTSSFKVCVTKSSGYSLTALLLVPGHECRDKARAVGEAIVANGNAGLAKLGISPITEYQIDVIGGRGKGEFDECVLRIALAHEQPRALQVAGLEIPAAALAMAPGLSGVGTTGRSAPSRRMNQFSMLVEKTDAAGRHKVQVGSDPLVVIDDFCPVYLPPVAPVRSQSSASSGGNAFAPLWTIAYGRSGDKGNSANIGIAARDSSLFAVVLQQVTADAVQRHFKEMGLTSSRVERFELPNLNAVNFLIHDVLGGGGGSSLLLDKQGKTFAQRLLSMNVRVEKKANL